MCRKSGGQVLTCQTSEFLLSIARAFIGAFGRLVVTSFDDSLFSITTSRVKPAIHSVYDSIYCNRKLLLQQTTRRCARQVCKTGVRDRCARQVCKTGVQDKCARHVCKTGVQDMCARQVCKTSVQDRCARQVCKTGVQDPR